MSPAPERFKVEWRTRPQPLRPEGLVVRGPAARKLAQRLLDRGDASRYRGVSLPDALVIFGEDLPWVDGATWLGQDPSARGLYLPTQRSPSVHPALLLRAVRQRGVHGPVAILPGDGTLVPLGDARPIDDERLRSWLG